MHSDNEYELTADETVMFAELRREMQPGDLLEERVVRALRVEGHLGPGRRPVRGSGQLVRIAAAIALFAGGVATGRYLMIPDDPQRAAAVATPASMVKDTNPRSDMPIPARGEIIVAETELWL